MQMKIDHVGLYVRDLEVAKQFFCRYFQATASQLYHNPRTHFSSYFLFFHDGARLEIMTRPEVRHNDPHPFKGGFVHLALSVGSEADVDNLCERLRADGYAIFSEPRRTGDGYYECCVAGPEGNLIEIIADCAEY